jgi:uroporphyrinogen decarboxylase
MDPERLKRDFGDQIAFWGGGVDTQHIIPFAKPDEVAEHVKKLIKIFAPKGDSYMHGEYLLWFWWMWM